jgi:hypothetical protein
MIELDILSLRAVALSGFYGTGTAAV